MSTTRVVSDGKNFYPQRKGWFGWKFYYEDGAAQLDGLELGPEIVRFTKLQDAVNYFKPPQVEVVWQDPVDRDFYF
jgi:hypothetical protein